MMMNLTDVAAMIADDGFGAADAPCWPEDVGQGWSNRGPTVWSWDFRGDDGEVAHGECEGRALIGFDGSFNDPAPYRIVHARLTAPNDRGVRYVELQLLED